MSSAFSARLTSRLRQHPDRKTDICSYTGQIVSCNKINVSLLGLPPHLVTPVVCLQSTRTAQVKGVWVNSDFVPRSNWQLGPLGPPCFWNSLRIGKWNGDYELCGLRDHALVRCAMAYLVFPRFSAELGPHSLPTEFRAMVLGLPSAELYMLRTRASLQSIFRAP